MYHPVGKRRRSMSQTGRIAVYLCGLLLLPLIAALVAGGGPPTQLQTVSQVHAADCAGYASFLTANGVSTNATGAGARHPGMCQLTDYQPTVAGAPAADYLKALSAWVAQLPRITYVGNLLAVDP